MSEWTTIHCPSCGRAIEVRAGSAVACHGCGQRIEVEEASSAPPAPIPPPRRAGRVKRTEFIGIGCVVQAMGLGVVVLAAAVAGIEGLVFGGLVGLVLLIAGGRMAIKWDCGACGNRLSHRAATICPACRATLD